MSKILLSLLVASLIFAKENKRVEVIAKNVSESNSKIEANGDVILKDRDNLFFSNNISYDREKNITNFRDNFIFFDKKDKIIKAESGCYNLEAKSGDFNNTLVIEKKDNIWLKSKKAIFNKKEYRLKEGSFSSCEVGDPDWKLTFNEGYYNQKEKFLEIYHTILYTGDIPIFYLPYFYFALERKSGLLLPKLGNMEKEGIYYAQPFYYAPKENWDLEVTPQIRTRRGKGLFSTFRFADSPHSIGEITIGGFWENEKYYKKYNLLNKKHLGFEVDYSRGDIFSSENSQDALFMDITAFKDTEYINTQPDKKTNEKLISSKINYFYQLNNHYFGAYTKYFIDTSKKSNSDTIQYLPTLQYHKYKNSLLYNNILYSIDTKMVNYYRKSGINAKQLIFNMPLSFNMPLFNDYLNFSLTQNLYGTLTDYSNTHQDLKNGEYTQTNTYFSLQSDLSKKYDNFFHTMNFNFYYVMPGYSDTSGYFPDFVDVFKEKEAIDTKFTEVFYNNNGVDIVSHSFNQPYLLDGGERLGDLEHQIKIRFREDLKFYNTFFYSHNKNKITKSQTTIDFSPKYFNLNLSHIYEPQNSTIPKFISGKIETKFSRIDNYFMKVDYNLKDSKVKLLHLGYKIDKKCWRYSLTYEYERVPTLLNSGSQALSKKGIFFNIELKPIGHTHFRYQKENFIKR